jgi:hypothetical protein
MWQPRREGLSRGWRAGAAAGAKEIILKRPVSIYRAVYPAQIGGAMTRDEFTAVYDMDAAEVDADSTLLGTAIAKALIEAYDAGREADR